MKKGIDVSVWQNDIDFKKAKESGIEFVILREGYKFCVDTRFFENVRKCAEADLPVLGVYHFSYAHTPEEAKEEAASCVKNVRASGLGGDTILFFDFEYDTVDRAKAAGITLGKEDCIAHTKAFCETVETSGFNAGIYSNIDFYKHWYDPPLFDTYILWLADWNSQPDYKCLFHQYSSKGIVPGIEGNVDMNWYYPENGKLPVLKPVDEVAEEVIHGLWGNGPDRKTALEKAGYRYSEIQRKVNEIFVKNSRKTTRQIAEEVIAGKWGNGKARKTALTKAGYDYSEIQAEVNKLL